MYEPIIKKEAQQSFDVFRRWCTDVLKLHQIVQTKALSTLDGTRFQRNKSNLNRLWSFRAIKTSTKFHSIRYLLETTVNENLDRNEPTR